MRTKLKEMILRMKLLGDEIRFAARKRLYGFDYAAKLLMNIEKKSIIPILKKHGAVIGNNCDIEAPLFFHNCQDFSHLHIGNQVHIGKCCFFDLKDFIRIEDNAVISMQTTFVTHIDMSQSALTKNYPPLHDAISIKKNSYIGAKSTILMGALIGENSLIAAGAVVTGEIKPFSVAGGIPARIISEIEQRI